MENQETNNKKDKNRRMYISVPNFSFHHATDEFSGFIGRAKIKERLKELLTSESENKFSGAYLVTGNRGVGKTTFVNKVKDEINTGKMSKRLKDSIVLMVFAVLINPCFRLCSIYDWSIKSLYALIFISSILSVVNIFIYVCKDAKKENTNFCKCIMKFLSALCFPQRQNYKPHVFFLIHIFALSVFIRYIATLLQIGSCFYALFALLYAALYMMILSCLQMTDLQGTETDDNTKPSKFIFLKKLYRRIYCFIKEINRPKKVFIKINLGQENIKVLDVLRLISYNITVEYRKHLYSGGIYILRLILVFIVCFLLSYLYKINAIAYGIEWFVCCLERYDIFSFILCIIHSIHGIIDYIFVILFTISSNESLMDFEQFLLFGALLMLYKSIGIMPYLRLHSTPFARLRELNELLESISASIKREEGGELNIPVKRLSLIFNRRVEKNYPMSDARDIEKKLIKIVNEISDSKIYAAHFILIFDELDKLESSFSDKQEDLIKSDSFSPDTIRKRREAVYTLLSGLKYLLTTMNAKFIFVAGRELYEAFRADASDRSHYMSSIFNDVIVVPSFMTDTPETKRHDIFCMTEQYVCRSLIPENYKVNKTYLNDYKKYLEETLDKDIDDRELVIQKTLIVLYNFIVYLTYASKGAPKKMVNLLERHIINKEQMQSECDTNVVGSDRNVKVDTKNSSFYLRFDYYDMYMFALMSRIVLPVVYRFDRGKKHKYGDKLLVTSMFFLDHLYKFHRNSFSWRALEASPEIIDVNKVPELREHINDILHYISQNDLKNISNGLYDFRFYKKIAQEISFLTRVSETASAFFNFTLDETYSVKQYYQRKLEKIRKEYDSDKIPVKNTVEELASIHFTLGELYLYEEEIADAVVEFDMAASILYTIEPAEMTSEHIVLLMKSMLSIGIAYEKQNQNDRALLIYIECVKFLIASKNTNINDFGLETEECASGKMIVYPSSTAWNREEPRLYFNKIHRCEEMSLIKAVDDVKHMHPTIHRFLSKIAAFDTLRLLYLPILAKLQILEKVQTSGLQLMDLQRCVKEFSYLANMMNKENKNILISNFFLKVGDILYYKNSKFLNNEEQFNCLFRSYFVEKDCCNFQKEDLPECSACPNDYRCHNSCPDRNDAYHFYIFALRILLYGTTQRYYTMSLFETIEFLKSERGNGYKNWDEGKFLLLATILTNLGDTIITELLNEKKGDANASVKDVFDYLREFVKERNDNKRKSIIDLLYDMFTEKKRSIYENNKLIEVLSYYILAYMYFKKGTSNNMASFQCYRILLVLKYHISFVNVEDKDICIDEIARYFTNCSIAEKGTSFKEMHFEDISTWIRIFGVEDYKKGLLPDCRNILYDESLETILLYLGIKLNTITQPSQIGKFQKMFKTLMYDNIGSILNRIKWLKFMSEINIKEIQLELGEYSNMTSLKMYEVIQLSINNFKRNPSNDKKCKKICGLLQSTIEKLYEAISLIKLYGENYALTNYYVADIYHRMMCVIKWKKQLLDKWHDEKELKSLFEDIGSIYSTDVYESISWVNVNRYYYKAKEMHNEGRTYKDMINRSCFLNDEFSDQRFHFITAHERWQTSSKDFNDLLKGDILKQINNDFTLRGLFKEVDFISKKQD